MRDERQMLRRFFAKPTNTMADRFCRRKSPAISMSARCGGVDVWIIQINLLSQRATQDIESATCLAFAGIERSRRFAVLGQFGAKIRIIAQPPCRRGQQLWLRRRNDEPGVVLE